MMKIRLLSNKFLQLPSRGARSRSCSGSRSYSSAAALSIAPVQGFPLLGPPEIHKSPSSSPPTNSFMDLMLANFNESVNESTPPPRPSPPPHKGLTENSSPTYLSSGNPCLDFFFHVVPNTPPQSLVQRLELAWEHDALTTLKLICNLLGVKGTGKSDRKGFYTAAIWLHKNHPKTLAHNVKSISQFGYFKNLPEILYQLLDGSDRSKGSDRSRRRCDRLTEEAKSRSSYVQLAKDPLTGCVYYYNETTEKSLWVGPSVAATLPESPTTFPLPPDWKDVTAEVQKGMYRDDYKTCYNAKTSTFHKGCLGCDENKLYWQSGHVHEWGYCDKCTRKQGKTLGVPRETRLAAEMKKVEMEKERARGLRKENELAEARKAVEKYYADPDLRFLHDQISHLFADHLISDLKQSVAGNVFDMSLASKWCPSLDSSFDRTTLLCESIAKRVFPRDSYPEYQGAEEAHYAYRVRDRLRKELLVPLRRELQLPEIYICSKRWNDLPYNRVASVAMTNYKELFWKHDHERFTEYLAQVKCGKAKIAAGALLPHEIILHLNDEENDDGQVAELQWKRMVDDLSTIGKLKNCIAVCDVSGSMAGRPLDVCVALGLLLSELSEDPWKGNVITFSANPQLHKIHGEDLRSKTRFIQEMEWDMNTDFQKVFDKILQVAIAGNLSKDKMIKKIFVFSDMEFDAATRSGRRYFEEIQRKQVVTWNTDYEEIERKFGEKGYAVPEIVFWNLRDSKSTPVLRDQKGVALVSGFSKNLMKLFLRGEELPTPETVMESAISGPEYKQLVLVD